MPYTYKKQGDQYCVYKKDSGEKVGCTDGTKEALDKYLAALHINAKENVLKELKLTSHGIKELIAKILHDKSLIKKLGFQSFRDILDHLRGGDIDDQDELEGQLKNLGVSLVYESKKPKTNPLKEMIRKEIRKVIGTKK